MTRYLAMVMCFVIGCGGPVTSDEARIGVGSGSAIVDAVPPPPPLDTVTPWDAGPPPAPTCAEFDPDERPFSQGDPIAISDECRFYTCESSSCGEPEPDGGLGSGGVLAERELIGSVVVVTKQGAPAEVTLTIVDADKGKTVASKKVAKDAADIALRTDSDIAGKRIVAIDSVNKKAYKIKQGDPGMIYLPDNKAKRYIEVEVTKDEDPTIIIP